jgi:hypothetical protein
MTTSIFTRNTSFLLAILLLILSVSWVNAQTTQFTYQGRLNDDGNPATGSYDFEFLLYDALAGGTAQGLPVQRLNVAVTNGIFTVQLDFGNQFNGASRFLDISVRAAGGAAFTPLAPRQQVTSNPYAIKSLNASTADGLSLACVNCVTSGQIQNVQGSQVTGSIAGSQINGTIPVASVPAGSNNYIQNGGAGQLADFNILGEGVAGSLEANVYLIGGARFMSSPGTNNTFVGLASGLANLSGGNNAFFGTEAGLANTSGSFNSFFGRGAGQTSTTGGSNSFFGRNAGLGNTTGSSNTLIGSHADVTTGNLVFATAIGGNATVDTSNTIVLGRSGGLDTVKVPGIVDVAAQYNIGGNRVLSVGGTDNTFAGRGSGAANSTGNSNAFFGRNAGLINSTGSSNSFFGTSAGQANTEGTNNSFFGRSAGQSTTTGDDNSFFGRSAGVSNTTGNNNAFFGRSAGAVNSTGIFNSFFGSLTGDSNTTGNNNTFFGAAAGSANTNGNSNTFVGLQAGEGNTTGDDNAFFGVNAGNTNTTGSSNTYIGVNAKGSAGISNATAIGANAFANLSNQMVLGTASNIVLVPGSLSINSLRIATLAASGSTAVCRNALNDLSTCSSSLRYKTNIAPFASGLSLVNRLRPITFDWKDGGMKDLGLGAEDVAAVEPLLVTYNAKGEVEGVKYDRVGVVLLNAVKEQQQIITAQQQRVEGQEEQLKQQTQQLEMQQQLLAALQKMLETQQQELAQLKQRVLLARPARARRVSRQQ